MRPARNHTGHRCGACHHRATTPDSVVAEARRMNQRGVGYQRIAEIFGVGKSTARDWVTYRTRWTA